MKTFCLVCLYLVFVLVGTLGLFLGIAGAMISPEGVLGVLEPSGLPLLLPLGVGVILFFPGSYLLVSTLRDNSLRKKVVAVAGSHKQITIDDISRQSGVKLPKTRSLVYDAIRRDELSGTVKENTFVRAEQRLGETVTIEKEVMVSRKAPENCFKCGASVNPQEVEWVGPDQVRCPHCGATMAVSTERL